MISDVTYRIGIIRNDVRKQHLFIAAEQENYTCYITAQNFPPIDERDLCSGTLHTYEYIKHIPSARKILHYIHTCICIHA